MCAPGQQPKNAPGIRFVCRLADGHAVDPADGIRGEDDAILQVRRHGRRLQPGYMFHERAGVRVAGVVGFVDVTGDDVKSVAGSGEEFTPAQRALFTVARKLAATPIVLTDDDVALAVKLTSPRDVVQLINYTTGRALFNRLTEAAGLQLEE